MNLKTYINHKLQNTDISSVNTAIIAKSGTTNLTNADANYVDVNTFFTGWCSACIIKRAETVASIDNYAVKYDNKQQITILPNEHWLNQLLSYPNKQLSISKKQLFSLIVNWLDKTGNCYLYTPVYSSGKPTNIFILPTSKIKIKTTDTALVAKYIYRNENKEIEIEPKEICHIKTLEPNTNALTGMLYGSPYLVKSAMNAILTQNEKAEFERKYYKREGISPVFLKTTNSYSDESLQQLKASLNEKLPVESPILGVLSNDLSLETFDLSTKNSNTLSDNKEQIKIIASIFGVPFGLLDTESQQNKATAETNYLTFRKDTIEPLLLLIEQALSNHFQQYEPNIAIKHDVYVDTDENLELQKEKQYLDYGIKTRNEIRNELGFAPLPFGDEPLIPNNLVTWKKAETAEQVAKQLQNLHKSFLTGEITLTEFAEKSKAIKKKMI